MSSMFRWLKKPSISGNVSLIFSNSCIVWITHFCNSKISLFRMLCKKADPPTPFPIPPIPNCFSPLTFETLDLATKTFWLLVLSFLSRCCKVSNPYLVLALNYLTLTNTTPQKITFSFRRPIEKLIFAETIKIVTKFVKTNL